MKTLRERLHARRDQIIAIAARHGAHRVRIFGSVARGSEGPSSDVDLLVSLDSGRTLFDIARLEDELEQLLGCPVDVATDRELADDVKATAAIEARAL